MIVNRVGERIETSMHFRNRRGAGQSGWTKLKDFSKNFD